MPLARHPGADAEGHPVFTFFFPAKNGRPTIRNEMKRVNAQVFSELVLLIVSDCIRLHSFVFTIEPSPSASKWHGNGAFSWFFSDVNVETPLCHHCR